MTKEIRSTNVEILNKFKVGNTNDPKFRIFSLVLCICFGFLDLDFGFLNF